MAYFSNGSEGDWYFHAYCAKCRFDANQDCPIWALHLAHNYAECNKPDSFLHALIPRTKDGIGNEECRFFMPVQGDLVSNAETVDARSADVVTKEK